jgi:hypothetical protein
MFRTHGTTNTTKFGMIWAWFSKPANHDFTIYTGWGYSEIAQLIEPISEVIGIPEESIVKGESWQDHWQTYKNAESQSIQFRCQLISHFHGATITDGNFPTKQAVVIYLRIPIRWSSCDFSYSVAEEARSKS